MSNTNCKTVINFYFDDSVATNKGWAYNTIVTTFDDAGNPVDKEHDTGAIDVKRRDAGLTTIRRAFFRAAPAGSFFANRRAQAASASWDYVDGGYRVTLRHNV